MAITRHPVQDISPNKLKPYDHNSKLHPEEQIEQIKKSIMGFGFLDPIAYDENFEILEGHGRLLAAQRLELKTVPAFQVTGLTEAEKRAYRIAHNKLTMNTDFDPDLLKIDFDFLSDLDFDLELTGFDAPDLTFYTGDDDTEYQDKEVIGDRESNSESNADVPESSAKEVDVDSFEFDCECPKCGFKFNK